MCSHWWVIESPDGKTSPGVCKLCGATREFNNAVIFSKKQAHDIACEIKREIRTPDIATALHNGYSTPVD